MSLDTEQVKSIANLARLQINETQISEYQTNLSSMLDLADQLQAADTEGVEPLAHPTEAVQRLRADEVTETNQRERFQKVAPHVEEGHYIVPKVVE